MNLSQCASIFVVLWIIIYATVYLIFLSPRINVSDSHVNIISENGMSNQAQHADSSKRALLANPFVAKSCSSLKTNISNKKKTVGVIIAARNQVHKELLQTVNAIIHII